MRRNECGQSRCAAGAAVGKLALITLVVLTVACLFPAAQAKDKPEDYAQVYTHTYDEVFQAVQDSIERLGCGVTNADKDKGIITGAGACVRSARRNVKVVLEIHIEMVSSKPETRVTINITSISSAIIDKSRDKKGFSDDMFSELHKVLATYK